LIFEHRHSVTKQKKKKKKNHHIKKEKPVVNDVDVQKEEIPIALYDNETNDQNKMILEDVKVQNQNAIIMPKGEKKKHQEKVKRKDDKIKSDSPLIKDQRREIMMLEDVRNTKTDSMTKNQRMVDIIIMEENQLYTETMNNMKVDLTPIVGYAEEPLLPLVEACTPLIDIIHNLLFYVQMALEETPTEPPDGLTIDESAAIRLYTIEWSGPHRSLYSMLNHTLKKSDRQDLRPYFKYMKLLLTALVKLPCIPPSTIWRGMTKNVSGEFPPDTRVTWWAFTSCTTELTVLENNVYLGSVGNRTLFSVEAINGRTVRAHSHFDTEDEVLLLPGTHMIVKSQFSPAPDLHVIHMKQMKPEEVLLEPPFEGNLNILIIYFKLQYFYI
jgi:hypothetical protein